MYETLFISQQLQTLLWCETFDLISEKFNT